MGIDPKAQGLLEHTETIDIIGEVRCWVRDLEEAWTKENERKRVEVTRDTASQIVEADFPAARAVVWEHFTVPGHRPKWQGSDSVLENAPTGRRGVGTRNHCMHGKNALIEDIVDWRPFDYVSIDTLVPVPNAPRVLVTYAFSDIPGGTRLEVRFAKPKPKDRAFLEQMWPIWEQQFNGSLKNLTLLVGGQAPAVPVVEEPALPVSAERFLTQPVHRH
jgi:hypothetical protein